MLYIFHVDTGTMMTFEMNLALESVGQLKDVIEKSCKIPVDKQVLLVSGGECLDPCAKVCSYSAGTDTNPIFLFSKCTLENANPPSPSIDYGSDSDMKEVVENSLGMPAAINTVIKRAQIAQQFCELAREHTHICEELVHDQHLQQQGWAAAVANLEDITAAFKAKSEVFEQNYKQYLDSREENLKMLQNFSSDLQVLAKIPILKPLLSNAMAFNTTDAMKKSQVVNDKSKSSSNEGETDNEETPEEIGAVTLLMWISTADNQSSLEQVAEQAQRGLEQFDEKVLEVLKKEIATALTTANNSEMKEIKGLEERLFGLEQLMVETKKTVQEQTDLAQALQQNQTRATSLNDPSVLPDLCNSHRKQLLLMLQNQHKLRDIRRRCSKAKEELNINLYHRLGWVMYVENLIVDVSNKLMIYHENLKRLRKYLEITRQVQRTPQVYVTAVSEVVRRRTFSQAFLSWASDLSCRLLAVYNEEFEKRKDFQSQFEGHFLQSLFPGLEDNPAPFATQAPPPFDVSLPHLTVKDLERLQVILPELPLSLSVTELSAIAQLFLTKSLSDSKPLNIKENDPVEEQLVVAVSQVGLGCKLDKMLLQPAEQDGEGKKISLNKEDKDFESETDTEEFEKVCQSPVEGKTSIGQKFEDPLGCSSKEVEALRFHLTEAGKLANETAIYLKTELVEMKSQSLTDKETILGLVKDIQIRVSQLTKRYSEEVEAFQKNLDEIMESRDSEIKSLKNLVEEKEKLLGGVTEEIIKMETILKQTQNVKIELDESLSKSNQLCEELKVKLEEALQEKIKAVESITEDYHYKVSELEKLLNEGKEEASKLLEEERNKLTHDHKVKVEELKSALTRIQLDSEIEREKTVSELQRNHAAELNKKLDELREQLTNEAAIEKQKAIKEITDQLTLEYKTEMENLRSRYRLMSAANMEKSPSDSSLENIEKLKVIEIEAIVTELKKLAEIEKEEAVQTAVEAERKKLKLGEARMEEEENIEKLKMIEIEAIVTELKKLAEIEKEKAVQIAIEAERKKLKLKLEEELKLGKARMEEEKQIWLNEAVNRALSEKNNEIQMLLARQESLMTECQRHRDTIKLLTEGDHLRSSPGAGTLDPLLAKIEELEEEKKLLASELDKRKQRKTSERSVGEMVASFAVLQATDLVNRDVSCSPEPNSKQIAQANQGKINIMSCSSGEAVLVVWNIELENYVILQEASTTYFLHPDSWDCLSLRPSSDGSPRTLYCTAEVIDKEYCQARKSTNRYGVPQGTRFYRVKVRPISFSKNLMTKSCIQLGHAQPLLRAGQTSSGVKSTDMIKSHAKHKEKTQGQQKPESFSNIETKQKEGQESLEEKEEEALKDEKVVLNT